MKARLAAGHGRPGTWEHERTIDLADDDPMAVLLARPFTAEIIHHDTWGGRFRYRKAEAGLAHGTVDAFNAGCRCEPCKTRGGLA